MVSKLITLEEHFVSSRIKGAIDRYESWHIGGIVPRLQSLGEQRLNDMDAGNINVQVISHAPTIATTEQCRAGNDQLAEACKQNPERFAGFAMLNMLETDAAASELDRAVKELGFVGALINNHTDGTFYDDEKFLVVFEKATLLDVPIYIHPSFPSQKMLSHYEGNYSDPVAFNLSIAAWGWHSETGLHILRLFAAGLFDKLPKLKLIIGHDGEMLPFMLDRTLPLSKAWGDRKRDLRTVWRENIWVTTSAMFSEAPLACLLKVSPIDKIMYSVDYPFAANEKGLSFVKELQSSELINAEQLDMICHGNAEKLLKLKVDTQ